MKKLLFSLLLLTSYCTYTMNTGKAWVMYNPATHSIIAYYHLNRKATFVTKHLIYSGFESYSLYENFYNNNKIDYLNPYSYDVQFLKREIEKFEVNLRKNNLIK